MQSQGEHIFGHSDVGIRRLFCDDNVRSG